MVKYGKKVLEKVEKVMYEMYEGMFKLGSGKKVMSKKQVVVIGLFEVWEVGGKVLKKKVL